MGSPTSSTTAAAASAATSAGSRAGAKQRALEGLNEQQRAAVTAVDGPLLVLAGAGSGKTRVITMRVAWLLANGVAARNVLATTFTNRAANEMKERVVELVGAARAKELTIATFHAFCVRVLREHGGAIGLPSRFAICDSADQLAAHRSALRELRVPDTTIAPAALQARVSLLKNKLWSPARLRSESRARRDTLVARAWEKYDETLRRSRQLDFDDLLLFTVRLLREHAATRAALADRFRHVLVDEYQDTNEPQYEILRLLCGVHRNLCVVGDDDQSIYGWRGADVRKILNFEKDFGPPSDASAAAPRPVTVVRLETNYRSTQPILDAANRVIRCNVSRHEKTLRSHLGAGEPVVYKRLDDELAEADFAAREIVDLMRDRGLRPGAFAVLFRAATQARAFEAALRQRSIPYKLIGGTSFFDRKEVRDVLAYLRLAANPDDELSLLRVVNAPPRGVGRATIDKALAYATSEGIPVARAFAQADAIAGLPAASVQAVGDFLATMRRFGEDPGRDLVAWTQRLLAAVGYRAEVDRSYSDPATREERWLGVQELVNFAENHVRRAAKPTLASFLEAVTLSEQDALDAAKESEASERDVVTLSTLHSAKGLEFERVYLVGVEEGLLPHARAVAEAGELGSGVDEERRLMYVGVTRARRHLTVTCVKSRARAGMRGGSMPSRFVYEMRGESPPEGWRAWEPRESERAA